MITKATFGVPAQTVYMARWLEIQEVGAYNYVSIPKENRSE
jgi:hypothetical protein